VAVVPSGLGEAFINQHIALARPREGANSRYIAWFVVSPEGQKQLMALQRGATKKGLGLDDIRSLCVPCAPAVEQESIVAEIEKQFTRLDVGVEALKRLQAHLRRYRAAVLKAAFHGKWRVVQFQTLLREPLRNGHSATKATNGGGIRTLTLTAVTDGEFTDGNTKLTSAEPDRVKDLWLQPGDLLIERSNTPELVGTARVYRGPKEWAIFPDLLIRARLNPDVCDRFIEHFLASDFARHYFRRAAQGIAGSMPKISQPTIEGLSVPLPPRADQDKIAAAIDERLSQTDAVQRVVASAIARASRLKAAVLRAAFEGRLVVQEPTHAIVA